MTNPSDSVQATRHQDNVASYMQRRRQDIEQARAARATRITQLTASTTAGRP